MGGKESEKTKAKKSKSIKDPDDPEYAEEKAKKKKKKDKKKTIDDSIHTGGNGDVDDEEEKKRKKKEKKAKKKVKKEKNQSPSEDEDKHSEQATATATAEKMNSTSKRSNKDSKSSRKRSHRIHDDSSGKVEEKRNGKTNPSSSSSSLSGRNDSNNKRQKTSPRPLNGMTISVSTLKDNSKNNSDSDTPSSSYNDVCQSCRDLGADVIDLVCKRVNILVCTEAAVSSATQRVRKAIKRNKPLVSVTWVEEVRTQGRMIDYEQYRLDKKAEKSIQNRQNRLDSEHNDEEEIIPDDDAGWTEPKELGYVYVITSEQVTGRRIFTWKKFRVCSSLRLLITNDSIVFVAPLRS
jgi:hypothetical protein